MLNRSKVIYPAFFKDVDSELVVKFTSIQEGTVVAADSSNNLGKTSTCWIDHNNTNHWIQVPNPGAQAEPVEQEELQKCKSINDILDKENKKLKKQLKKSQNQKLPFNTDTLADKQLVWAWDHDNFCERRLTFWDKQNQCLFYSDGDRDGARYSNYKPYKGKTKNWMKKAIELLEY